LNEQNNQQQNLVTEPKNKQTVQNTNDTKTANKPTLKNEAPSRRRKRSPSPPMWNENRSEEGPNRTTESEIDPTNASQERC